MKAYELEAEWPGLEGYARAGGWNGIEDLAKEFGLNFHDPEEVGEWFLVGNDVEEVDTKDLKNVFLVDVGYNIDNRWYVVTCAAFESADGRVFMSEEEFERLN